MSHKFTSLLKFPYYCVFSVAESYYSVTYICILYNLYYAVYWTLCISNLHVDDENRVALGQEYTNEGEDYINASYISVSKMQQ